jgi:hypothetical protein
MSATLVLHHIKNRFQSLNSLKTQVSQLNSMKFTTLTLLLACSVLVLVSAAPILLSGSQGEEPDSDSGSASVLPAVHPSGGKPLEEKLKELFGSLPGSLPATVPGSQDGVSATAPGSGIDDMSWRVGPGGPSGDYTPSPIIGYGRGVDPDNSVAI